MSIIKSTQARPQVFLVPPGTENDGESAFADMGDEVHYALVCIPVGQQEQAGQAIATAQWLKEKLQSPLTRIVLLLGDDFPAYNTPEIDAAAGQDEIYSLVCRDPQCDVQTADKIRATLCAFITDREMLASQTCTPLEIFEMAARAREAQEDQSKFDMFRRKPTQPISSALRIYYREP